ncbi:MAG: thiamine pyrophosphate-dependent enzyme [Desulfobacterales bacterium]|nr:thiamine pyrophosphate-dependent enzyme [Desulfobacterales bacterium]MDD4071372.1 thiamine pyrophosphate-dependent enzyme [Desulfobacterales bacterium]MDD4392656.1 thiamine pyrophosphate-dependent enzyme [Desulfobacterales bacterium]
MTQLNISNTSQMCSGHVGCPGCGATIAMKLAFEAFDDKTIIIIPACCWAIVGGFFPNTALKVPIFHTAIETCGAAGSGIRAALDMKGDTETNVVAWAGDGGTFDIGFQSLSGAAERNENMIYVCYDNEAYMNTGIQRSSATPYGAWTTTTPGKDWKQSRKKNLVEAMAAHRVPYAATTNIAFPEDMIRKFKKAKEMKGGFRLLHVFSSCPTGWRVPSEKSIKVARLASQTNVFPLYEVEDGKHYTLNYEGHLPVADYLSIQGRYKHLTQDDINQIQHMVDDDWDLLARKIRM